MSAETRKLDAAPRPAPHGYHAQKYGTPDTLPAPGAATLRNQRLRNAHGRIAQRISVHNVRSAPTGRGISPDDQRWYGTILRRYADAPGQAKRNHGTPVRGRRERLAGIHAGRLTAIVWEERRPAAVLAGARYTYTHPNGYQENLTGRRGRANPPGPCSVCRGTIERGSGYAAAPAGFRVCAYCLKEARPR